MTEITEAAAVTATELTDEKVDEFFNNGGQFDDDSNNAVTTSEQKEAEPAEKVVEEAPKEEKKVNLGALHEERQRRKELQAKLAEYEKKEAEWTKAQQPAHKEPSFEDDPIEVLRRENEQIKGVLNAQFQTEKQKRDAAVYWSKVSESEQAFKQETPDFDDAVKFLADNRIDELKDIGWNEQQAMKILADEVKWISDKAYQDEVNPAERFYNLAKRRGYKAAQAEEPKQDNQAEAKLKIIKKGIETNKQLPPASRSVKTDLTAEALADMNIEALGDSDFDSAWKKLFG